MVKPRYSEADRRDRNSNQDVTNIGIAGRRTGLRVEGARRGSDGFENESAYFSPTTTAKKANKRMYSSPQFAKSATKQKSGSIEDMELEASMRTLPTKLTSGSAQDVAAVLRRRSEGPQTIRRTQLSRRSMSPTKTYLNSPALRVPSSKRAATSPPKSALKNARRSMDPANAMKIARKLDFSQPDLDENFGATPRLTRHTGAVLTKPLLASPRSIIKKRKLIEVDLDGSDEMTSPKVRAIRQETHIDVQQPTFSPANDYMVDYIDDAVLDQPFEDDVEDSVREDTPPPLPPKSPRRTPQKASASSRSPASARKSPKSPKSPISARKSPQSRRDDTEPVEYEAPMSFAQDVEESVMAAPSEDEEPPRRKRGRPPKKQKEARVRPVARPSFSPSRTTRERSTRTASPQREWREPVNLNNSSTDPEDGVRKSSRFKIAPLAFWRGEKMVYGRGSRRKSAGGTMGLTLPEVKEIIHVDIIDNEQIRRKQKPGKKAQFRRNGVKHESQSESEGSEVDDGENWEDKVIVEAPVRSFENQAALVKKVLAVPEAAYDPRPVHGQGIFFQKTLSEEPHFASGVLDIPAGASKPVKPSKQNTMFFFIFTGYVQVKIHDVVFRLRKGGQFTVPRGNFYEIDNVGRKDARLFFSQSTDTLANHLIAHPEVMAG